MTTRALLWLVAWSLLLLPTATRADDLTGANQLICAAVKTAECYADGTCAQGEPEDWNIPRFMHLDLIQKTLDTTKASGEKRSTPLEMVRQDDERVFIQGAQSGRAISMVVNQSTGLATAGIVLDGHVLTVFAYCTPFEDNN